MTLKEIAADLVSRANTGGIAKHRLRKGLALSIQRNNRQWALTAGRPDVAPSALELVIVARAFDVPPGTDPQVGEAHVTGIDGLTTTWHTVTWKWMEEAPAPTQPTLIPDVTPHKTRYV